MKKIPSLLIAAVMSCASVAIASTPSPSNKVTIRITHKGHTRVCLVTYASRAGTPIIVTDAHTYGGKVTKRQTKTGTKYLLSPATFTTGLTGSLTRESDGRIVLSIKEMHLTAMKTLRGEGMTVQAPDLSDVSVKGALVGGVFKTTGGPWAITARSGAVNCRGFKLPRNE